MRCLLSSFNPAGINQYCFGLSNSIQVEILEINVEILLGTDDKSSLCTVGPNHNKADSGLAIRDNVYLRGIYVESFQFLQNLMPWFIVPDATPELGRGTQLLRCNQRRRHHTAALNVVLKAWKNPFAVWKFGNNHQVIQDRQTDSNNFRLLHGVHL